MGYDLHPRNKKEVGRLQDMVRRMRHEAPRGISAVQVPCLACGEPWTEDEIRDWLEKYGRRPPGSIKPGAHIISTESGFPHTRLVEFHGASLAITFGPTWVA
jgi:hypothetical protein